LLAGHISQWKNAKSYRRAVLQCRDVKSPLLYREGSIKVIAVLLFAATVLKCLFVHRWCLRAREVVEAAGAKTGSVCPDNHISLTPQMDASSPNGTRLTVIHRSNTKEPAVLFHGSPSELHQAVEISNWVPTASYLSPYGPELLYNSFRCDFIRRRWKNLITYIFTVTLLHCQPDWLS
jgi:hypothetical protein